MSAAIIWLNSDIDRTADSSQTGLYTEIEQDDLGTAPDGKLDWQENIIPCERDLEDFARLWISMPAMQDAFKSGQMQLGLKWTSISSGSPAVKMYPAVERDGGTKYLTDSSTATQQIGLDTAVQDARDTGNGSVSIQNVVRGTSTFILPKLMFQSYMPASTNPSQLHLIFEGVSAGTGELQLVILDKDGNEIGQGPGVWMDLKEPNQFVERYTCGDTPLQAVGALTKSPQSGTFAAPAADEEKDYVLYIHGYNMKEFEKQRWLETTFKRLYWLGFKGRVGSFSWPCSDTALPYDQSEERAWQSGALLRQHLANLQAQGYRVHVLGHSQGNVVVGEALRQWKELGNSAPFVASYIASQAAIEAHCYDPSAPLIPDFADSLDDNGTPNVYLNYPPTGAPYMAVSAMSSAASRWANFENPQDYALTGNSLDPLSPHPGWQANQRLKPDTASGLGYSPTYWFYRVNGSGDIIQLSIPADRFKIFSYLAEGRSLALGSTTTAGVFDGNNTNLQGALGYGPEHRYHSAQFRSFYATRYQYWRSLMRGINLQPFTP